MIEILFSKPFKKNFKKRINSPKLIKQFEQRVSLFITDPQNKALKDHQLKGKMQDYRAFSITGDVRVIYEVTDEATVTFVDIGSHNQVY